MVFLNEATEVFAASSCSGRLAYLSIFWDQDRVWLECIDASFNVGTDSKCRRASIHSQHVVYNKKVVTS